MQAAQLTFLLVVFTIVCALAGLAMALFAPVALRTRLRRFIGKSEPTQLESNGWVEKVAKVTQPLTKLSIPEEGWEKSALRTRFMNAGWRNPVAPTLFFASKTALALLGPAIIGVLVALSIITLAGSKLLFLLLLTATVGYYLPNMILNRIAGRRKREIFESLPDALDLLTVCVEAGLSLERAFVKVAGEIHIKSVILAQELQIVLMEMRAGFSKEKALRNFGKPAQQAPRAGRGMRCQDRPQAAVPAHLLHLPDAADGADGPGRHPAHPYPCPGRRHALISPGARS